MFNQKLISKSKDVMRRAEAEIGQSIALFGLDQERVIGVVIAAIDGTTGFAFHMEPHLEFPLHTSAPGKAYLAYCPKTQRKEICAKMDFRSFTPNTITNESDFEAELESVLDKGYAIDLSEEREGVHCIAVPIFDPSHHVISALWATGPSSALPLRLFPKIADVLKKNAKEITRRLDESSRSSGRDYINSVVEQAREILAKNIYQPIDIQDIAANLYVSYSWLRRVFKEQIGQAPTEYHQHLRIQKAAELLRTTELSVRQISEELGFKNQNHFSALFKRKTGHSPLSYRTSAKSD